MRHATAAGAAADRFTACCRVAPASSLRCPDRTALHACMQAPDTANPSPPVPRHGGEGQENSRVQRAKGARRHMQATPPTSRLSASHDVDTNGPTAICCCAPFTLPMFVAGLSCFTLPCRASRAVIGHVCHHATCAPPPRRRGVTMILADIIVSPIVSCERSAWRGGPVHARPCCTVGQVMCVMRLHH